MGRGTPPAIEEETENIQVHQSQLCANDPDNFNALKFGQEIVLLWIDRGTGSGVG
jgi:hypothetical protein